MKQLFVALVIMAIVAFGMYLQANNSSDIFTAFWAFAAQFVGQGIEMNNPIETIGALFILLVLVPASVVLYVVLPIV